MTTKENDRTMDYFKTVKFKTVKSHRNMACTKVRLGVYDAIGNDVWRQIRSLGMTSTILPVEFSVLDEVARIARKLEGES